MHNGDGKKLVYLGMPSYGELTDGAARAFYCATAGGRLSVNRLVRGSSLLALNMNHLWCWALNAVHRGERVDYFAMQHSDIEPQPGWLDELVAELEAQRFDVLGVVAPIKDQEGKTSIALAHESGDPFRVHCRLTMREIYRLPETFTSADVGHPLLINTGLWVVRWNQDWCRQVHFTVNDEIVFNEAKDAYEPLVESEDWFISRAFHGLGLKVGCTRKIELGHRGPMLFGNHQPWGTLEFDKYNAEKSPLDDRPPCDWFPHSVAGWLSEDEGRKLAELAAGKAVLEIGAYCGRSTICLAQKAKSVGVIDTFDGRATPAQGDTFQLYRRNLRRHGVAEKVTAHRGTSRELLANLPPIYDLVFIDGDHGHEAVLADAEGAARLLRPGGLLVFHDYGERDPGVVQAVDELVAAGAEILDRCGDLAVVRPAGRPGRSTSTDFADYTDRSAESVQSADRDLLEV
jgi:SAM-dependent methyltransferase